MKVKPIFTVSIPSGSDDDTKMCEDVSELLNEQMKDYHTLVFVHGGGGVKFEAFYEKDFNKVKFEELKKIVKDKLKGK